MEKNMQDYIKYYIGCEVSIDGGKERGRLMGADLVPNSVNQIYYNIHTDAMDEDEMMPYNDEYGSEPRIKPILHTLSESTFTDDLLAELWTVIGGTPHLFEYGKDALKEALLQGYWDDTGIQMDFYTMAAVINKLREMDFDCDDLIPRGLAIEKQPTTQK